MDKELLELINDYIKAYKAYNKKDDPTSYDYTLMQSPAINILTKLNMSMHITYSELYDLVKKMKENNGESQ